MSKISSILEGLNQNRIESLNEGKAKEVIGFRNALGNSSDSHLLNLLDDLDDFEKKHRYLPSKNDKVEVLFNGETAYAYYVDKVIKGSLTQCIHVDVVQTYNPKKDTYCLDSFVIKPMGDGKVKIADRVQTYKDSSYEDITSLFESISISGLDKVLDRFDSNGKSAKQGKWSIGVGGYDLDWELYYDGESVIDCIDGEIKNICLDKSDFDKVSKIILKAYPDVSVGSKDPFVIDYKIPDDPNYNKKRIAREKRDEDDYYDRVHKEGRYAQ